MRHAAREAFRCLDDVTPHARVKRQLRLTHLTSSPHATERVAPYRGVRWCDRVGINFSHCCGADDVG